MLSQERHQHDYQLIDNIFDSLYDWQSDEVIGATKNYRETCLCAANRVGKTRTGTLMDACHITGHYPDGYTGHMFDHAPVVWCLGYSGEKTRDLLQSKLFGLYIEGGFSGGLVPRSKIIDHLAMGGTAGAMRSIRVLHKNGGISICSFWSYAQGAKALMGDEIDWFHLDEEPIDQNVYPQVTTRTATGDRGRGGRGVLTFTPENGRTPLVIKFMDNPSPQQKFIRKGWDDAPHITKETRESLLGSYPEHQKDMRTKGIPMLGHGRIYDMAEQSIVIDPFDIPHHWRSIGGIDFGWDHPQAIVKLAWDMENDVLYLTNEWRKEKVSANDAWGATKSWIKGVPVSFPHDGLNTEKGRDDAKQQVVLYREAGFRMLHERATFDGVSNSVEQGVYELRQRMRDGRFKVFRGCRLFLEEFGQYHRDDKSKIVRKMNDVLDATRYAMMMRRFSKLTDETAKPARKYIPKPLRTMGL